jgi:signal transduction histidine kinase/CheY-like chemotaxis protein
LRSSPPQAKLCGGSDVSADETLDGDADDVVANRQLLVGIGMAAVGVACVTFAGSRLWLEHATGLRTPWWANAGGAAALGALFLWYRAAPARRSSAAVHGTAAIATTALLIPAAYGMPSSKWWLSLVGFCVLLMGRRSEAMVWAPLTLVLVPLTAVLEPFIQLPGAAGEPALERALAGACYVLLLFAVTFVFRQVSHRRAFQLTETARSLERAAMVRGRFLARMSHELRTPLHGVLSMTELALRHASDPRAREPIETASQSASVLLGLLNNILDVTRAEADAMTLNVGPFSLHEALTQLLHGPAAEARSRQLRFEARAEPGIAEQRTGDRTRVMQVVLNLVGNALKFTAKGGVSVSLLGVPADPDRVRIRVSDTGCGIAPDKLGSVFEPFEQASTADAERRSGAGLGLAIVRELTRLMDGTVHVTSTLHEGSTFVVDLRLPRVSPNAAAGPESLLTFVPSEPEARRSAASPRHILVCEDDPAGRRAICALLRLGGHHVVATHDGHAALATLATRRFDLLITDIEIPGIDGVELIRRIRSSEVSSSRVRLPIIATTAHAGEENTQRLYDVGVDAHITKPFTLRRLEDAIATQFPPSPEPGWQPLQADEHARGDDASAVGARTSEQRRPQVPGMTR